MHNTALLAYWGFLLRPTETGSSSQQMLLFLLSAMPSYREMLITYLYSESELGLSLFPLGKTMSLQIHYYKVHDQNVNMNILETGL